MSNAIRIIMLGRQGAGKGTQCVRIASEFGAPHISTGEMLRAAVRKDSPLGRAVKEVLDKGELVNDELMISLVQGRIGEEDARVNGFILDGFPRTVAQAQALDPPSVKYVQSNMVIDLEVKRELVLSRLSARRVW
jgi:adenylate kinase